MSAEREKLLNKVDEVLMRVEDFAHGTVADGITEARMRLRTALHSKEAPAQEPTGAGTPSRRLEWLGEQVRARGIGDEFDGTSTPEMDLLAAYDALASQEQEPPRGGAVCSHGHGVLVTHINDAMPCSDYLLTTAPALLDRERVRREVLALRERYKGSAVEPTGAWFALNDVLDLLTDEVATSLDTRETDTTLNRERHEWSEVEPVITALHAVRSGVTLDLPNRPALMKKAILMLEDAYYPRAAGKELCGGKPVPGLNLRCSLFRGHDGDCIIQENK